MADRVRMKSKSIFDNPFIYNHAKEREGRTTVQDGDEFSTEPEHAVQLEDGGLAEKISGDVSDRTDRQTALKGAQTSGTGAIITNRPASRAAATTPAAPTPAA